MKSPAWNERDTKVVAAEGNELQRDRRNWRKVIITSNEVTGDIVVEYQMLKGGPDSRHYTREQFAKQAYDIAWLIASHVCL